MVIGRWYCHNGYEGVLLVETLTELTDILTSLLLRVNHNAIGTTLLYVCTAALQCIVNALASNETLAAGNNHEVLGHLSVLACTYLLAEMLYSILCLDGIGAEERVFLQSHLVLNDNGRDTVAFQGANSKDKMFQFATCVTIVDNGFRGALQYIGQVLHTGGQVYCLNIGLTL